MSVVETTTGGLICARIVGVPGSSAYFDRGVVAYSKASKLETLGLDEGKLAEWGAVSEETAAAMAEGIRRMSGSTLGLSETGIAGPVQGRSAKPLGTAYLGLSMAEATRVISHRFEGDRDEIRAQIVERALEYAVQYLEGDRGA